MQVALTSNATPGENKIPDARYNKAIGKTRERLFNAKNIQSINTAFAVSFGVYFNIISRDTVSPEALTIFFNTIPIMIITIMGRNFHIFFLVSFVVFV